jgi:hypothetical protein
MENESVDKSVTGQQVKPEETKTLMLKKSLEDADKNERANTSGQGYDAPARPGLGSSASEDSILKNTEPLIPYNRIEWYENNSYTLEAIKQLKERNVLFIKVPDRNWGSMAVQRLSAKLQTYREELWPLVATVRKIKNGQSLPPCFWKSMAGFESPTVIVLDDGNIEHIISLLLADDYTVRTDIKNELERKRIHLVCPLEDSAEIKRLLQDKRAKRHIGKSYACWEVNAVKLLLMKLYGKEGDVLYNSLQSSSILRKLDSFEICEIIDDLQQVQAEHLMGEVEKEAESRTDRSDSLSKELVELFDKEDLIVKTVMFCAAFFPGLNENDFKRLVEHSLGEEKEEVVTLEKDAPPARSLRDIWGGKMKPDRYLRTCKLQLIEKDGIAAIGFEKDKLGNTIAESIRKNWPLLYNATYDHLTESGILFNPAYSDEVRNGVVKLIVQQGVKMKTAYLQEWFLRLFFINAKNVFWDDMLDDADLVKVAEKIPESIPDAILVKLLIKCATHSLMKSCIVNGLTMLFREMLLAEDKIFHDTVKSFFKRLIDLFYVEKAALDIVINLYSNLWNTNELPEEELLKYFGRAFEEGNDEKMFYAYGQMVRYFKRWHLYEITGKWIDDESCSEKSWTKKMAWLFQLDFCVDSIDKFFGEENKGTYELFIPQNIESPIEESLFSRELPVLLKKITSENCLAAWDLLFINWLSFKRYAYWLEHDVTKVLPLETRLEPSYQEAYTLAADIIENWFYILSENKDTAAATDIINARIKQFAELVKTITPVKIRRQIVKYWRQKVFIYADTIHVVKDLQKDKETRNKETNTISRRRSCLRQLMETLMVPAE